ncbi:MAG: 2Fe-2S iron-sulfur cluster-binding protein [Planctomycetota bacterium]
MTKIILNGEEVEVDPTKPLIAACHEHAENVPMYCYHPGLSPVGSCRICQVNVKIGEMPARTVVACRTPITEGMIVDTEAPAAHDARRQCLEFLLKNHPLDCPICDKAGECDLQDYAFAEGQGEGRSVEPRRKLEKRKSLGDVILLDQERCILCSRCVRFFEEVPGKPQLTVADLGARSVIATFNDRPLEGNYQGNVADICPVGALTLKEFRFQARVWNLKKTRSTCGECSRGCAITHEVLRGNDIKRVRPRFDPEVNQYWMCDRGRFAFGALNRTDRLEGAALRVEGGYRAVDPTEALETIADAVRTTETVAIVASPWLTLEEGAALLELARSLDVTPSVVTLPSSSLADDLLHTDDESPNRRGLVELGFAPKDADVARAALAGADVAFLVGERGAALLGVDELAALPRSTRLVLFDETPHPAAYVQLGVPNAAERAGTWVNVDGHHGQIAAAKPAPAGVVPLERHLERLATAFQPAGGSA